MQRLHLLGASLLAVTVGLVLGRSSGPTDAPGVASGRDGSESAASGLDLDGALRALEVPEQRWRALWWLREQGEQALPALAPLVGLLGGNDAVAQRLAAEVLGRIGPAAAPAEAALREAWDRSLDEHLDFAIEGAMQRIGGWSCFRDGIPDDVSDPDRPFLRVVAEAHRRTWLKGEDADVARRARREADEHARRLVADRLYRLGEQTRTLTATTGPFHALAFESRWSPPFLLCVSDGTSRDAPEGRPAGSEAVPGAGLARLGAPPSRFRDLLDTGAEVAQAVYRGMLGAYGDALGVKPLEAPFGGRPDLKMGVRSFEDGFPIVVWIWADRRAMDGDAARRRIVRPPRLAFAFAGDGGPLELVAETDRAGARTLGVEAAAFGIATSLLEAFSRQARKWAQARPDAGPLGRGLALRWAGWERDAQGHLAATGAPDLAVAPMRQIVEQLAQQRRPSVPWVPIEAYVEMRRTSEVIEHWQKSGAPSPALGEFAHLYQAWGLVRWLETSPLPARQAALLAGLRAYLQGEAWPTALRAALGVRDAGDWEPAAADYQAWLEAHLAPAPGAADPGAAGR